jgi:mono/diheme cytochrome c family protein
MSALRPTIALLLLAVAVGCRPAADPAREVPTPPGAEPAATEPAAATLPLPDLGYDAREGRALFEHYCSTCHGVDGHGDGFNAYNLDPKPRDLSDPAFQAAHSDAELTTVIRSGGPAAGLSNGMPAWGRTLSERRIHEVVIFLRTLKPEEN